jgi:hypothetical protein
MSLLFQAQTVHLFRGGLTISSRKELWQATSLWKKMGIKFVRGFNLDRQRLTFSPVFFSPLSSILHLKQHFFKPGNQAL